MNSEAIARKFSEMGARIRIEHIPESDLRFGRRNNPTRDNPITLNIANDKNGEVFILRAFGDPNVEVLNINKRDRHLLLMNKTFSLDRTGNKKFANIGKFLCGHDERHWFVAGVDNSAKDVVTAKQSLKPPEVTKAEINSGIAPYSRKAHKHRNKARIRQGEWMFIPVEREFEKVEIHTHEPIRRGSGKPHMCEELVRIGGETVMVHRNYPNGISVEKYNAIINNAKTSPTLKLNWNQMKRGMTVYVKGRITHPDHKTVILKTWHIVIVSNERMSSAVAFLD